MQPNEVAVNVNDLLALDDWWSGNVSLRAASEAIVRLVNAIPQPEFSDDQINAFAKTFGYQPVQQREVCIGHLRKLKDNGLRLP